jgi:hypothetical protein
MNLRGTVAKNAQETVRVLGGLLVWISGVGVAVYAAGILFARSGFAGRWVVIWLALGWVLALMVLRSRVVRLERKLIEVRKNEMLTCAR